MSRKTLSRPHIGHIQTKHAIQRMGSQFDSVPDSSFLTKLNQPLNYRRYSCPHTLFFTTIKKTVKSD